MGSADESWKKAEIFLEGRKFILFHPDENDHIFSSIRNTGNFYELELLIALGSLLRPGDLVVDVGANIGNHALYFAGVCGCRVLAFEPNPAAAKTLRKNVEANGLEERIKIHEVALGSRVGSGNLVVPAKHNLGMVSVTEVEDDAGEVRIDLLSKHVGSEPIRLIKIDAEGMDFQVLLGAEEIIARDGCAISVEAATREEFLKIDALVERHGYVAAGSYNYTPTHLFLHQNWDEPQPLLRAMSRQMSLDYVDHAAMREALNRARRDDSSQNAQRNREIASQVAQATSEISSQILQTNKEVVSLVEATKRRLDLIANIVGDLDDKIDRNAKDVIQALQDSEKRAQERYDAYRQFSANISSEIAIWKDEFSALFRCAVLAAEVNSLHEAVQTQEQQLLNRNARIPRGHLTNEDTMPRQQESAPRSKARPAAEGTVSSVWQIERDDYSANRETTLISERIEDQTRDIMLHASQLVADERFEEGWSGRGWVIGVAQLEPGGLARATTEGDAGFVTRKFPIANGGIFEISVDVADIDDGVSRLVATTETETGEGIGHEIALHRGLVTFRAFATTRTRELKLRVIGRGCKRGASFIVRHLTIRRLDSDAHQRAMGVRIGAPVLASMASIPSRREMLEDSVNSLLPQCDRVRVFLNNYPDVPEFLKHPRVDVKRSQDWDDRGDAGKVYWLEHDAEPGYRLIVDDDLLYPPDFAEVMCRKVAAKHNKAIFATHGVILRQPIQRYYETQSRAVTFHFASQLEDDRSIHIATTGCTCFHSDAVRMRWADFKYCNSADIWLTLYAQENNIPVLTPSRPRNWIRENKSPAAIETIYNNSLKKTRTRFDSSIVQDAVLRHSWPLSVCVGEGTRKYGLLLKIENANRLGEQIGLFIQRYGRGAEWVVMLAYDRRHPAIEDAVASLHIDRETHLIDTSAEVDVFTQATKLIEKTHMDAVLVIDGAALGTNTDKIAGAAPGEPEVQQGFTTVKLTPPHGREISAVVLAENAETSGALLRQIDGFCPLPSASLTALASTFGAQERLPSVARNGRFSSTVNNVFEDVKVLNLDRRPDRWRKVSDSLARVGIQAERFSAVDGTAPEVAAEYEHYTQQQPLTVSPDLPPVRSQTDLYLRYASQMARVAYLEENGKKAIASPGAWGYLRTYERVLEDALERGTDSLLVFDDDVLMHKDTEELFSKAMKELPDDWLILQLGTLQYNWNTPWAEWHSPMLYRTNGSAIGSHAVGMRFDVIPYLLDQLKRFDMPYDVGALSAAVRAFPDRCFVIYPNLAIQSMLDTDIGTSRFMENKHRDDVANTYRWNLRDYI